MLSLLMWIIQGGGVYQWTVLRHNGPFFPDKYKKHNIPVLINNKKINLNELSEEYATLYAKYIDSDYVKNNKFNKNFWNDFKITLPKDLKINSIHDIDFSLIKKYLDDISEKKKNMTKEEKEKIKLENEKIEEPYKYCFIDGTKQKVGNYKIEPPGIFLGRGDHPKIGMIKKRILPEDVIINLDKESKVPEPNIKGHKWKKVIHDRKVIWLATWKDSVTNKTKYIFTSMASTFKSESDKKKFDLAKKLKKKIKKIRIDYESKLVNEDLKTKQLATALYFIDNLALRVGGKKNKKEKADTVGVTSLRVEHITLFPPNEIKLDFLGKDSIRYCRKVNIIKQVYDNIEEFTRNKDKKKLIFDLINSNMLNNYLSTYMKNLTAKVWRTFNASFLFQKELNKIKIDKINKIPESERLNFILSMFQQENAAVAILCNHQKNVSSNLDNYITKTKERIKKYRLMKKKLKKRITKTKDKEKKNKYKEKILRVDAKIKLLKLKLETKSKMKNVSLGTSKTNYIDPRIIFSFIKKFNIPLDKIFTKTEIDRFQWANDVDEKYQF